MAGLLVYVWCTLMLFHSTQQSCENTYGTDIDFNQEYLVSVVTNCSAGMTVTFNDGTDSEACHQFFKPFDGSYYMKRWMPNTEVEYPSLTLTFEEPVFISSLRMLDSHNFHDDPPSLDMVTFITFTRDTEKEKFTWSKAGMISNVYFHVLHFETVRTDQLTIEFIPEENKIWLAYLEVNELKVSVRENMLDLSQANVSCSPDKQSHCSTIYDGDYTDLDRSWQGNPTDHYSTVTIELGQTYRLQLARIFLSSFQCTNVMMNVSVICDGQEWVFGRKNYSFSNLSFIVFPMYSLETDSFSVKFDCYRDNSLPSTLKVVEVEFYGSDVFTTASSTADTSQAQTSSDGQKSGFEGQRRLAVFKREANEETDTTTTTPETTPHTQAAPSDPCVDLPTDTGDNKPDFCRNKTTSSRCDDDGNCHWNAKARLCPWDRVVQVTTWFVMVHHNVTSQCEADHFDETDPAKFTRIGNISEEYHNNSCWSCCPVRPEFCEKTLGFLVDMVNQSFSCNVTRWKLKVTINLARNDICKSGSSFKMVWSYNGSRGVTSLTITRPQDNDDDDDDPMPTQEATSKAPSTITKGDTVSSSASTEPTATSTGMASAGVSEMTSGTTPMNASPTVSDDGESSPPESSPWTSTTGSVTQEQTDMSRTSATTTQTDQPSMEPTGTATSVMETTATSTLSEESAPPSSTGGLGSATDDTVTLDVTAPPYGPVTGNLTASTMGGQALQNATDGQATADASATTSDAERITPTLITDTDSTGLITSTLHSAPPGKSTTVSLNWTESTTETLGPAAQSIGGKLTVTSENYTPELADTSSQEYVHKEKFYGGILLEAYRNVITSTSQIYNMTFTQGSIATNYVADTLDQVTLTDGVKQQLTDSIVNTFKRNNITVDPSSIDFTDLFGTTTVAPTKSTPENEILAGVLGAVATLLVIALVIAGVTVRMCLRSQRDATRSREHELDNNNGTSPSHFQYPPMFGSSQTSSSHSYPAFFSSSVRNQGLNYRRPLRPRPPEAAVFDFPTAPKPFPHPQASGTPPASFDRDRNDERIPPPRGDYIESPGEVPRFQQSRRKRKKSQEYMERSDATSLTGYMPRRTEVPSTKPSRNVFERAAMESEDEAYFTSDINYPYDGLHRSNSISLHRNRGYDNSYDTDYGQEEVEIESRFHRSEFRPEPVRQSGRATDSRRLGEGPSRGYYHDEQRPHPSPQYHRDSLRVQRDRQLQRNLSHDSEAHPSSSYHHRSRPGPYAHDYYNPADDGVDSDALRPYYLAPEHSKPKGFLGRLSKKLSAPRVKKSGQNVHRQPPAYEREPNNSNA